MLDTVVVTPPRLVETTNESETQIIKVYYKDNTFKSYDLHVDVMSADVCAKFALKFLRISERAAAHFSLHLVMQGLVVKQLKPTDRPIKIQKELASLGYKFNTNENDNYFLFSLKEEAKTKMNHYYERNSVSLARSINIDPPSIKIDPPKNDVRHAQAEDGHAKIGRTQSMLALLKPSKEKMSTLKRKVASVTRRKDTNLTTRETSTPSPVASLQSPSPQSSPRSEGKRERVARERRSTIPDLPIHPYPCTPPSNVLSESTNNTLPPIPISSWSPGSPTRRSSFFAQIPPAHALPAPPSPKQSFISPTIDMKDYNPMKRSAEAVNPMKRSGDAVNPMKRSGDAVNPTKRSGDATTTTNPMKKSAGEDLETVINSIFGKKEYSAPDEEDVGKMMDHIFDWYPSSAPELTPVADGKDGGNTVDSGDSGDDFNEILDALRQLSNA